MNVLILGDGPEELAWARALADHPEHRLLMVCPGGKAWSAFPSSPDLDAALATAGIDAVIVGGKPEFRAEGLRRAASVGLPVLCLHPPGPNADPYYQIALSHLETGAVVVPDLPARRHPGVLAIRDELDKASLGAHRELRFELPIPRRPDDERARPWSVFARAVDVGRSLLGEIEAVSASGDPPGPHPSESLIVHLRASDGRRAEVRITVEPAGLDEQPIRLAAVGAEGSMLLEIHPDLSGPSRLVRRTSQTEPATIDLPPFDRFEASLETLAAAARQEVVHPDLLDGTRAMELAEAVERSLRRGRTVDLHYEEISEANNFKSVMTGVGCGLVLATLFIVLIAMAGPFFGAPWTVYLAWVVPPALGLFAILQLLRFVVKSPRREGQTAEAPRSPAREV